MGKLSLLSQFRSDLHPAGLDGVVGRQQVLLVLLLRVVAGAVDGGGRGRGAAEEGGADGGTGGGGEARDAPLRPCCSSRGRCRHRLVLMFVRKVARLNNAEDICEANFTFAKKPRTVLHIVFGKMLFPFEGKKKKSNVISLLRLIWRSIYSQHQEDKGNCFLPSKEISRRLKCNKVRERDWRNFAERR